MPVPAFSRFAFAYGMAFGLLYVVATARDNESFQAFVPLLVFAFACAAALRERHRGPVARG